VANLAVTERYYYEEHGEFTSDLDKLQPIIVDERLTIGAYTDVTGQYFCVDAHGEYDGRLYGGATWDHEFTPDGERVHWWPRGCGESFRRPIGVQADSS
jgi:hypothetical protein